MEQVQLLTGLGHFTCHELYKVIEAYRPPNNVGFTQKEVLTVLLNLKQASEYRAAWQSHKVDKHKGGAALEIFATRLIGAIVGDVTPNKITCDELIGGLAAFTSGSTREHAELAFRIQNIYEKGLRYSECEIEFSELAHHLECIYKAMNAFGDPSKDALFSQAHLRLGQSGVAKAVARDCFLKCTGNSDPEDYDTLRQRDFVANYHLDAGLKIADRHARFTLNDLKSFSGLHTQKMCNILDELVANFNSKGGHEGFSLRNASEKDLFECARDMLLRHRRHGTDPKAAEEETNFIMLHVFGFDSSNSAHCYMKLVAGLVLLCDGDMAEKSRFIFDAINTTRSAHVSYNELAAFLMCLFRIQPAVHQTHNFEITITPKQSAEETALECFKRAGKQLKEGASLEEFYVFFSHSPPPKRKSKLSSPKVAPCEAERTHITESKLQGHPLPPTLILSCTPGNSVPPPMCMY